MQVKILRLIYRIIILVAIFIGALSYFSKDIKEVVFDIDNTTTMAAASFPLVSINTGGETINRLFGYSSNLDADMVRDSVIPLALDKTFAVIINQEDYIIKKLNYEVRDFKDNTLIESNSISVFEENSNKKTAKIKIKAELMPEKEYAVKITLVTSESKKMYYYQRIKIYEDAHLGSKLSFIMNFHNSIMNKAAAENIIKYLEPSNDADNTSLAHVNINSSFDLVSWGNLKPTALTEIVPSVKEIYKDTASVELKYIAQAEVAGVTEEYQVTEFYRVRYSTDRMYLLNYERYMDALFDVSLASVSKNELKLGITSDLGLPYQMGADKSKLAFIRDRELYFYDLQTNEITKVFSFRQENTDNIRDLNDQHNIRIINMDAEGNIDFTVYGYMNRGQYEGRVAIILYRFIRAENRIEELVYIPVEEPYQTLKEHIGELFYVNSKGVFYFQADNNLYTYDLITRKLAAAAEDINKALAVVYKESNYVVWQENSDPSLSNHIYILNMESGKTDEIPARDGYNIRLMDKIDSNIVYGYVNKGDIATMLDGSVVAPLTMVDIASIDRNVLKSYNRAGFYIFGVNVQDNRIELDRVSKVNEGGRISYIPAAGDSIMNQKKVETPLVGVTSRVTDQSLTEYYMTLPPGFTMQDYPKVKTTVNTVITQNPTVRLPETAKNKFYYYPYTVKGIEGEYENAADAIVRARDGIGVVIDSNRQIVWERGVKTAAGSVPGFDAIAFEAAPQSTVEGCLKIMLACQGINVSPDSLATADSSAYEVLKERSKYLPVRLTGIALDDVLYYVSKGRPVLAMTGVNKAVVIYGYDTFNIMIADPATGKKMKLGIQDSTQLFNAAGNVFLSWLE